MIARGDLPGRPWASCRRAERAVQLGIDPMIAPGQPPGRPQSLRAAAETSGPRPGPFGSERAYADTFSPWLSAGSQTKSGAAGTGARADPSAARPRSRWALRCCCSAVRAALRSCRSAVRTALRWSFCARCSAARRLSWPWRSVRPVVPSSAAVAVGPAVAAPEVAGPVVAAAGAVGPAVAAPDGEGTAVAAPAATAPPVTAPAATSAPASASRRRRRGEDVTRRLRGRGCASCPRSAWRAAIRADVTRSAARSPPARACTDVIMPIARRAAALGMTTVGCPACQDVLMPVVGPAVATRHDHRRLAGVSPVTMPTVRPAAPTQPNEPASPSHSTSPTRQAAGALRSSSSCTNVRTAAPVPPCGV